MSTALDHAIALVGAAPIVGSRRLYRVDRGFRVTWTRLDHWASLLVLQGDAGVSVVVCSPEILSEAAGALAALALSLEVAWVASRIVAETAVRPAAMSGAHRIGLDGGTAPGERATRKRPRSA